MIIRDKLTIKAGMMSERDSKRGKTDIFVKMQLYYK